ncbi:hypothetical protein AVEN_99508-1, partial [Araneus ventricosus]
MSRHWFRDAQLLKTSHRKPVSAALSPTPQQYKLPSDTTSTNFNRKKKEQ